jgi:putative pyoverdin transport system ATP-binding/permease protein
MVNFLRFLWEISWRHIVIATTAGLVSGCGNALLISLINQSVNRSAIPNALTYFAVLGFCILFTSILAQFILIQLSQNAIYQLRLKLSQTILASPLQHLERLGENRLLATLTDDVRSLTHAVSSIPMLCIDFATVAGCLVYLAWLSGLIFALTVGCTSLTIWGVHHQLGKARLLFSSARDEEDTLIKHFQAITKGTKELKLHRSRRKDFFKEHLEGSAGNLRQKNTSAMKGFAIANGFGQLSQFATLGFIIFVLPWLIQMPMSVIATYVLTSTFLAMPMQNLLSKIPELMRGNIALRKIERMKLSLSSQSEVESEATETLCETCHIDLHQVMYLYHPEPEEEDHPPHGRERDFEHPHDRKKQKDQQRHPQQGHPQQMNGQNGHPQQGHPQQMNGHFQPMNGRGQQGNGNQEGHPQPMNGHPLGHMMPMHPPHDQEKGFLLGPISLSLQPGEITYLVGGNGSGKSTLAKLITGLYSPQQGEIYMNGVAVGEHNLEWYRQHFSAIFTDFYLFDRYLGFSQANLDEEVQRYLKHLQLDHKVQVQNGTLSTTRLSQGQQKRLALLTAYLEDRPIYVFDEWASDQEPLFRELFYKEILVKLKERGKTVVVITHDDRYFHLADHMIKLDYGRVESDQKPLSASSQRLS